jgi:hypothetical protein
MGGERDKEEMSAYELAKKHEQELKDLTAEVLLLLGHVDIFDPCAPKGMSCEDPKGFDPEVLGQTHEVCCRLGFAVKIAGELARACAYADSDEGEPTVEAAQ